MKKMMILIAAMAMTTLAVQANDMQNVEQATATVAAVDTEAPAPTDGDTNGTEEAAPEGK
ncbi:MAG TPA: hypothetical protein ENK39_00285 [Epsilonproteobacteria bacterium]|nr:hypothetical protein [Campylobacterota bacterium]